MIFKKTFFLFFLIISSFSCHQNKAIEKKEFMSILYEIHKCEAYNELKYSNENMAFQENCKKSILDEHKIEEKTYQTSIEYYKKNYAEFEAIYDSLIATHEAGKIRF